MRQGDPQHLAVVVLKEDDSREVDAARLREGHTANGP